MTTRGFSITLVAGTLTFLLSGIIAVSLPPVKEILYWVMFLTTVPSIAITLISAKLFGRY